VACIVTASHKPFRVSWPKAFCSRMALRNLRTSVWLEGNWECFGQPYVTETSQCVNVEAAYGKYLRKNVGGN